MPGPAVYVLAVVGTVAAGIAFKEFIYEPHLAPKIEQWAENFIAKRQARRRERERRREEPHAIPMSNYIPVPEERAHQRRPEWASQASTSNRTSTATDFSGVEGLRQRSNANHTSTLDESNVSLLYQPMIPSLPMSPVHVIASSNPSTPSTEISNASPFRHATVLPSPPATASPTSPRNAPSPVRSPYPGTQVPSLSSLHPVSDHELTEDQDVELLSAPSTASSMFSSPVTIFSTHLDSRPESRIGDDEFRSPTSPFSTISEMNPHPLSQSNMSTGSTGFYSMPSTSPPLGPQALASASDDDEGSVISDISDISWSGPAIRQFD